MLVMMMITVTRTLCVTTASESGPSQCRKLTLLFLDCILCLTLGLRGSYSNLMLHVGCWTPLPHPSLSLWLRVPSLFPVSTPNLDGLTTRMYACWSCVYSIAISHSILFSSKFPFFPFTVALLVCRLVRLTHVPHRHPRSKSHQTPSWTYPTGKTNSWIIQLPPMTMLTHQFPDANCANSAR